MAPNWMPFYVSDYLADTGHLSTLEHGAYSLLIWHYWQRGGLPTDDAQLARIVRLTLKEWQKIRATIASFFGQDWSHKRIDHELARAEEMMNKRSAAGKASAEARYNKRSTHVEQVIEQTHAPLPSPSPLSEPNGSSRVARKRAPPSERLPSDWQPSNEDQLWAMAKGFSPGRIAEQTEAFKLYWTAEAGPKASKLDWSAAWKNWMLRDYGNGRSGGLSRKGPSNYDNILAGAALAVGRGNGQMAAGMASGDSPEPGDDPRIEAPRTRDRDRVA